MILKLDLLQINLHEKISNNNLKKIKSKKLKKEWNLNSIKSLIDF